MIHTKLVTFPLTISNMQNSTKDSTKCIVKLCNTAKRKCGKNTKCPITLPVYNRKFIFNTTINNYEESNSECKPDRVTWTPEGQRRGVLAVQLSNTKLVSYCVTTACNVIESLIARKVLLVRFH